MKPGRAICTMAIAALPGGSINWLQILSVALFEKMPLQQALSGDDSGSGRSIVSNQLHLFAFQPYSRRSTWRMKMLRVILALFLIAGVSVAAWADDITYRKHIRPLWEQKCAACHSAGSPYIGEFDQDPKKYAAQMKGPRMDTYADLIIFVGWPDTGAVMRRLDDGKSAAGGKPGNMYQYLGATDEERAKNLKLVKEWVGKDAWKLNRWEARGNVPAITKQEMDKIKVKY